MADFDEYRSMDFAVRPQTSFAGVGNPLERAGLDLRD